MAWFLCALNVFLHVQNLWYLHPKFSSDDNPSATWIFFGGKNIWLFTSSCTTFFISSRNSKLFFLYLGPKLFRFWLQPVVENHNHFEKMMMLSFLAYEIRTDDRVYVKFIFKYISEFFTAILINKLSPSVIWWNIF